MFVLCVCVVVGYCLVVGGWWLVVACCSVCRLLLLVCCLLFRVCCCLVFVGRCVLCVACLGSPLMCGYWLLVVCWLLFVGVVFRDSWLLCVCCGVFGDCFSVFWRSSFGELCFGVR